MYGTNKNIDGFYTKTTQKLFDTNDVSGVHISSSGEEKLCEIFSKYLTALPGKSEFPVTPQHDKQELSLKKRCTTKHKYVILLRTVFH